MKINRFVFFMVSLICMSFFLGVRASAEQTRRDYIVSEAEEGYALYLVGSTTEMVGAWDNLSDMLSEIPSSAIISFDSVSIGEQVLLPIGEYFFRGKITLLQGGVITIPEGASLSLSDMVLDIPSASDGYIRIKGGSLTCNSGTAISSPAGTPVVLDFSSSSLFRIFDGSITSSSAPCISSVMGRVDIVGGVLSSAASAAVKNSATLSLGGSCSVLGSGIDIETDTPIWASYNGKHYSRELRIKFSILFEEGSMREVVYSASAESASGLRVYDKNGRMYEAQYFESSPFSQEKKFAAVYQPYLVIYYDKNEKIAEREILDGMCAEQIEYPIVSGYYSFGWYADRDLSLPYDFSVTVNGDTEIFLKKSLQKPQFSLSSLSFTYDGAARELGFSELSHPLDSSGIYSYEWYKNGELISSANELGITRVEQSGSYFCKLKFSYNGDFVEIRTPEVTVSVKKRSVALPSVLPKAYTGYTLYPDIEPSQLYVAEIIGALNVGEYPVTLKLNDSENYKWESGEGEYVQVIFRVTGAENSWRDIPSVSDSFVGVFPRISCTAAFGEVRYLFSGEIYGEYTSELPRLAGRYYLICEVVGTDNYSGIRSEPISFSLIAEAPLGMYIERMPDKTEYTAFESFLPTGISVVVDYNSGRQERIGAEVLGISYPRADSFRYGDSSVLISYCGISISVAVSVKRAEYDVSAIRLPEREVIYSGEYRTLSYLGELPIGRDGVMLSASIVGGGITVGEYKVSLVFSTESENYVTPEPIHSELRILPMAVSVFFDSVDFVYNGLPQAPRAYFLNENFVRVPLSVIGARTNAGEGYSARLISPSANYMLDLSEVVFSIKKADYDLSGVSLDNTEFVYDGQEKRVTVIGLPIGVTVIGYADNSAVAAGTYLAGAILSYDSENYNEPSPPRLEWKIERAEYELSGIVFMDRLSVYNGEWQYPQVFGSMPVGLDGIMPTYSFSLGVLEVTDEPISVEIRFFTESENYKIPESITRSVQLTPMPISVEWGCAVLTYNKLEQVPSVYSEYTALTLNGGGVNCGNYLASVRSNSKNYTVINPEYEFVIVKAENFWITPLEIADIFEGEPLCFGAEAAGGSVSVRFFSDSMLTSEIDIPTECGIYFAVAYADESENYLSLIGEPVSFEIKEVVLIGFTAELLGEDFCAYQSLNVGDFALSLYFNSGEVRVLDGSLAEIIYQNGDSLRRSDTSVKFKYLGFETECVISVGLATYDLSGVRWENERVSFSGAEQRISVTGLPQGVFVREYIGGVGVAVGEYPVSVQLGYDEENYYPPPTLYSSLKIEKCRLPIPIFQSSVYDGQAHLPQAPENTYFISEIEPVTAGVYELMLGILDCESFVFEGGSTEIRVSFEIERAELILTVPSIKLHLFEELTSAEYTLLGLVAGDTVSIEFFESDGILQATADNPNYTLKIVGGEIERLAYPSRDYLNNIFVCILLFAIFALAAFVIMNRREQIGAYIAGVRSIFLQRREAPRGAQGAQGKIQKNQPIYLLPEAGGEYSSIMSVDMPKADSLISDTMAKNLIKRSSEPIVTSGSKRAVVNIGAISTAFSSGDEVDINKLKAKRLVGQEVGFVKVLADGIIDKQLFVYANSFSLSAVKMIALTGGEAVKVSTVKKRKMRSSI